jgi:hypothetical protein
MRLMSIIKGHFGGHFLDTSLPLWPLARVLAGSVSLVIFYDDDILSPFNDLLAFFALHSSRKFYTA